MYIGRKQELAALRQQFKSDTANITAIYGRRRVGKTSLTEEAARGHVFYSFEGLEQGDTKEQKRAFIYQLKEFGCKIAQGSSPRSTWMELLGNLTQLITPHENTVILLDEFQWLANYSQTLVSHLKLIWDQKLRKHPTLKLVICGSVASFIVEKVIKSKALYGRIDLAINLAVLPLTQGKQFFPEKSPEEIMTAYILVGGIPKYLHLLQDRSSVLQSLQFHSFRKLGYFAIEYEKIFVSHFGSNANYEKIIRYLAQKYYGASRKEISNALNIANSGELTRLLDDLAYASFITPFVPVDKKISSHVKRFLLTDCYIQFYLRFLEPLVESQELEKIDFVRDIFHTSEFKSFLGKSFELLCYLHRDKIADLLGFGKIKYQAGPFFRHGKRGEIKGVQLDLVYKRADLVYTICEIRYSDKPNTLADGRKFAEQIAKIEELERQSIETVLITKSRPSEELLGSGYFSRIITVEDLLGDLPPNYL